jgi:hypothetical protein
MCILALQIQRQATAFDDAFLLTVGIVLLGVVASLFLTCTGYVRRVTRDKIADAVG